jgi:hypothetical protein
VVLGKNPNDMRTPTEPNNGVSQLVWQRGFRCHTLWLGEQCIGRITLEKSTEGKNYRCQAGTRCSDAALLKHAKAWVLSQAALAQVQHSLF